MGCDYYMITKLVIEYKYIDNNGESKKEEIEISTDRCYLFHDYTIDQLIDMNSYEETIYNDNWLIRNEDLIELYEYVLEQNNINMYDISSIKKVKTGKTRY
jgi:hypothetical protein